MIYSLVITFYMYLFPTATAYGYVHSIFIGFSSAIQSILFYGDTAI